MVSGRLTFQGHQPKVLIKLPYSHEGHANSQCLQLFSGLRPPRLEATQKSHRQVS